MERHYYWATRPSAEEREKYRNAQARFERVVAKAHEQISSGGSQELAVDSVAAALTQLAMAHPWQHTVNEPLAQQLANVMVRLGMASEAPQDLRPPELPPQDVAVDMDIRVLMAVGRQTGTDSIEALDDDQQRAVRLLDQQPDLMEQVHSYLKQHQEAMRWAPRTDCMWRHKITGDRRGWHTTAEEIRGALAAYARCDAATVTRVLREQAVSQGEWTAWLTFLRSAASRGNGFTSR